MKAISIKQPWASLIVQGFKKIENRNWKCPQKYIGTRVLIHASAKPVKEGWNALTKEQHYELPVEIPINKLSTSKIIGSVEIVGCVQNHYSVWAEKGVYNWVLANAVLYEYPIENVKGKLSFWEYKGIEEVTIECPECGTVQVAVADHTTVPFSTYIHDCKNCGFIIMESDWCEVKEDKK